MGCGCKKNQEPEQPVAETQQTTTESVKKAVTKIVQKYYNKK